MRILPLLAVALGLGACGGDDPEVVTPVPNAPKPAAVDTQSPGAPALTEGRTGKEVYKGSCAMCHGDSGDGKGIVKLDRPARSFLDGGFSFGNTPEAVFRTVSHGIGGTPMPGFASILSVDERQRVTQYVIELGPDQIVVDGSESIMEVKDKPLFARGQFKSVAKGAPEIQRGLLVGTLDGLSFQYQIDDVRLLAVRQGRFVNRTDWTGRGGTPLEPLGKIIHLVDGGTPQAMFELRHQDGKLTPLRAKLRSTRTTPPPPFPVTVPRLSLGPGIGIGNPLSGNPKQSAWLIYDLIDEGVVKTIHEHCWAVSNKNATGYTREFDGLARGGQIVLSANRSSEGKWIRTGTIVYRTIYSGNNPGIGPGFRRITHTVLVLPDTSDDTYKKLMQELQR